METKSLTTNYTERGTGSPLVFIHGGWLSEKMWRNQIERFEDEYRVITYDIRGHGQTGSSSKSAYSIDLFTEDLRRLLTDLSVEMPVLCGLSLGGMIAQRYASRYPNDVSGIILANTVQSFPPLPLTHTQKELLFPKIQRHLMLYGLGPQLYFKLSFPFFQLLEGHQWISLEQDTRNYVLRDVDRIHADEFVKIFDAMYNCDLRNNVQITNPTLVITSDHEHYAVRKQNVQITKNIRNSSHVEIPDAGHLVNMDNSREFNSEVDDFISGL
ncbi:MULTISPECIES: alpha/beta hydrolase [unclassified Haladaptatus]|uniref:alpha/beta fold hydrolase n=1 Tax=unclassified Haladaptatus TaxID=2622732 RepID=UPI00209BE7FA|nr:MULTISPECIES: alpha/beta hydrolase [unclassified Haladaptatus]MCO8243473.1 alpha/beta hydrolase [Haladaptatus sp. AB643]MCO8254882.1 alpha/beta hydrolase [Haladaptatus sp. AB618]